MTKLRTLFFRDLAQSVGSWTTTGAKRLKDPKALLGPTDDAKAVARVRDALAAAGIEQTTIEAALFGVMEGLAHSFLVMLDGGTALANVERVYLVDSKDRRLGEGLHELFFEYLIKNPGKPAR
jgi:hypothetical protein